jgi:hypothetical protein
MGVFFFYQIAHDILLLAQAVEAFDKAEREVDKQKDKCDVFLELDQNQEVCFASD